MMPEMVVAATMEGALTQAEMMKVATKQGEMMEEVDLMVVGSAVVENEIEQDIVLFS